MNKCACGCGVDVAGTWKRGHATGRSPAARANHTKHGHGANRRGRSPTFITWMNMIQRCTNPSNPEWPRYGGRGITVCERWRHDFAAFLADMGERPRGRSVERVDNDHGYESSNCVWATAKEQANNRRYEPPPACPAGHVFDEQNTFTRTRPSGRTSRECRVCMRTRSATARASRAG